MSRIAQDWNFIPKVDFVVKPMAVCFFFDLLDNVADLGISANMPQVRVAVIVGMTGITASVKAPRRLNSSKQASAADQVRQLVLVGFDPPGKGNKKRERKRPKRFEKKVGMQESNSTKRTLSPYKWMSQRSVGRNGDLDLGLCILVSDSAFRSALSLTTLPSVAGSPVSIR